MRIRIGMTVSDRPHYLDETLQYWSQVRGLEKYHFTFHVEPSKVLERNLQIIDRWEEDELKAGRKLFQTAVVNNFRMGVLLNPWHVFEQAFLEGADFVILCEEDTPVSRDILEYFEWASKEFESDVDVLGVCAFSPTALHDYSEHLCAKVPDFNPLVWGTWKDRWNFVFRNSWDKDYSTGNPDGSEAGWDWNIKRIISRLDKHFVFPLQSRSTHIGVHGAHMLPIQFPSSTSPSFVPGRPIQFKGYQSVGKLDSIRR